MLSNWEKQAVKLLETEQYENLLQWCDQAIQNNEQGSLPYWYLGLAYLLQQQAEEAQSVWLSGWFEAPGAETSDERTAQLVSILEREAQRQEGKGDFLISANIREQLQEIQPENLNNSLNLIQILINHQRFSSELLEEWEFLTRLEATEAKEIDESLLRQVLALLFVQFSSIDKASLVKIAATKFAEETDVFKLLVSSGGRLAYSYSRHDLAIELMELCEQLQPNFRSNLKHLTQIYTDAGYYRQGIETSHKLIEISETLPEKVEANCLLLRACLSAGAWLDIADVIEKHHETLEELVQSSLYAFPNKEIISILPLNGFYPTYVRDSLQKTRRFQNRVSQIFQNTLLNDQEQLVKPHHLRSSEKSVLRIGYISYTLRYHSVGWLARWLLQNHNRKNVHVSVYLIDRQPDNLTKQVQRTVDHFRLLEPSKSTWENARIIANDDIDILIDLDSATYTKTCQVLAYKPAPVQVTWLGWDASGLPAIDYYIADPYVLPEDAQDYYQETIWRLPNSYVAIKGFEADVPTLTRKQLEIPSDAIIYFTSQAAVKRHPETVALQMRILKSVPNSYLLIKGKSDQDLIQNFFQKIAEAEGVDPQRLRFLGRDPSEYVHRANLRIADVVLDTYPYNGATTTLETLWMGVPLVTKVGQQYVARNSYTFLKNVGVEEGIAWTDEEYVEWGVKLGTDENLRRDVHWKLLQSRKTAPLWNVEQFVTDMETAYQQMWAKYVEKVKTYPVAEEATSPEEKQTKPKLRLLHNLPRCGGTIISKCLATMENNLLLSEIHPRGMETFHPAQQADEWFNLLSSKDLNDLASKPIPFIDVIRLIHQRSEENNGNLIIRDWAHLDFFGVPWLNNLSYRLDLTETLKTHFDIIQAAIVRHPVDQWLSLRRLELLQGKLSLEDFLHGYLEFAKIATEIGFIRYEDFTHNPDTQLQALCEKLETPFDSNYKEKWQTYKKITGETASQGEITPQPRRHIEPELLETIEKNEFYQEAIALLGYDAVNSK